MISSILSQECGDNTNRNNEFTKPLLSSDHLSSEEEEDALLSSNLIIINQEQEQGQENEQENENTNKNEEAKVLKEILSGLAGNLIEYYDFAVYGYVSDAIGDVFFPEQEGDAAMIESFIVFGGSFLMRPLGALLSGYIGDKFGAKTALTLSIFLMAVPTFAIGCLPTFDQVGYFAIFLLVLCRMLQGLAVGGQLASSFVFTLGKVDENVHGYYGGLVMASTHTGALIGSIFGYILRISMSYDQLKAWGWRIPFLCGIFLFIPGFYLKNSLHSPAEVPVDETKSNNINEEDEKFNPIKEAFRAENRRMLVSTILVSMLGTGIFNLTFIWMAIYMDRLVDPPVPQAFLINSVSLGLSHCLFAPVAGILSDKYGRMPNLITSALLVAILGPIMIAAASTGNPIAALLTQSAVGVSFTCWVVSMWVWLYEQFPAEIRLTAIAVGYNISSALVGGFTPAIATVMVDAVGLASPGILYVVLSMLALIGLYIAPRFNT